MAELLERGAQRHPAYRIVINNQNIHASSASVLCPPGPSGGGDGFVPIES
jgi:hypothetical protein